MDQLGPAPCKYQGKVRCYGVSSDARLFAPGVGSLGNFMNDVDQQGEAH
jgi:hypothetical protein